LDCCVVVGVVAVVVIVVIVVAASGWPLCINDTLREWELQDIPL